MGLLKAGTGAVGGVLADQWREFFYCDSLDANVLAAKGQKRTSAHGRSSNTKGEDNIISDGSIVAVNEGQCMIIVEQGAVVEVCAEPGEFVFESSSEPSVFAGNLGDSIRRSFETLGRRFTFGGDTGRDQRIYFFNTKEIVGNKYGTASPVPFRVVDRNIGLDVDIAVSGSGSSLTLEATGIFLNYQGNVTSALSAEDGGTLRLDSSAGISVGAGATIAVDNGTLETAAVSGVTLKSGAKIVLEDGAHWSATGDVTLASGAEMTVSIAKETAAAITFSDSAALAFEDGAILNLTLGEGETLESREGTEIVLSTIFSGAALSVGNDMKVGILASDGVTELGRYDVQKDDGKVFIVIPEPSAFGLLAGAFALVCAASRRRRK